MIEIVFFLLLGTAAGIGFGLIPGLHPNTLILAVPLIAGLSINPISLLAFVTGLAVANSLTDFIPSILIGAPDDSSALSVLPGHKMLLEGRGYEAVKLTVIGGVMSVLISLAAMPLIILWLPAAFAVLRPYTHILLIFISAFLILGESGIKKVFSLIFFAAAGIIGLSITFLPIDNNAALFPVLAGMFGVSSILIQVNSNTKVPKQKKGEYHVSRKLMMRSSVLGTAGGIVAGLLPGVGTSSIASVASTDKKRESFLVSIGAITTANIIFSVLSLWLISQPRSGAAVIIDQLVDVGFSEFLFILVFAVAAAGIAAVAVLKLSRVFLSGMHKINYKSIGYSIVAFTALAAFALAGPVGLLLLFVCSAIGVSAQLAGARRGILMGVLILPTILFFSPL